MPIGRMRGIIRSWYNALALTLDQDLPPTFPARCATRRDLSGLFRGKPNRLLPWLQLQFDVIEQINTTSEVGFASRCPSNIRARTVKTQIVILKI